MLPISGLQQRGCYHSLGYGRGDTATLWVTAEGILPLSQLGNSRRDTATVCLSEGMLPLSRLQQRGCYHSLGYRRGDTATLWVTAEGILPCTLWDIAEGILPLSVFQRVCYHFLGYSRGDTVCLSENTHHIYLYICYISIYIYVYLYICRGLQIM